MKMPAIKAPSLKLVSRFLGGVFIAVGLVLAGAGLAPYFQPYNPWAKPAVAVPVRTASISVDPYAKRTAELCASAADSVARMREELKELKAKAAAKIAPAK